MNQVNGELLSKYEQEGLIHPSSRVISLIGSGGKTSILFQLATEYANRGLSVAISTTTKMFKPKEGFFSELSHGISQGHDHPIQVFGIEVSPTKIGAPSFIDELHERYDRVLIEADGSNRLPLKYPADFEPVITNSTDTLLLIAGLSCLGKEMCTVTHRAELVTQNLGIPEAKPLTSGDIYRILTSGYSSYLDRYRGGVVLNQVETDAQKEAAQEIVRQFAGIPVIVQSLPKEMRR